MFKIALTLAAVLALQNYSHFDLNGWNAFGALDVTVSQPCPKKESPWWPFTVPQERTPQPPPTSPRPTGPNSSPPILQPSVQLLYWLVVAMIALLIVVLLYYLLRPFFANPSHRIEGREPSIRRNTPAPLAAADDLIREAERLAALGDYRAGLRALYRAILRCLDQIGVIEYDETHTNWEYLHDLQRHGHVDFHRHLLPMTELFERTWYGREPINLRDFEYARDVVQTLLRARRAL